MDQCRHESAMILFTVMDHDVITSNDFAGEAFLSLNSIPGVLAPLPHDINAIDRVDLILMHQQNKSKYKKNWFVRNGSILLSSDNITVIDVMNLKAMIFRLN